MKSSLQTGKANILVIDDDPLLTQTLKKALTRDGYDVDCASDGFEGIRKARTGFFHLILCDVRMPGLDGIMTIRHIREFQDEAGAGKSGFIVISGFDPDEASHRSTQLGVTDFVRKPFDLTAFLSTIDHHIKPLLKEYPADEVDRLNQRLDRLLRCVQAHHSPKD